MSNVANWVTKFVKFVCGPWLSACQKFNPDTSLKLALPVPECLASKTLFHTWCEAAFRRSKAALATMCLEKEGYVSISSTVHTSESTKNKLADCLGDVRVRPAREAESFCTVRERMRCTSNGSRWRQDCDRIGSPRSSVQSRAR